jgi:hypothetical protein
MLFLCCGLPAHSGPIQTIQVPGKTQYDLGQSALKIGNNLYAMQMFVRAVELNPEYIEAIKALASTAKTIRQGMQPEMRSNFTTFPQIRNFYGRQLAAKPNNEIYQWALGLFDDSQTQEEAERCFNKAIALNPRFVEAYESLASTLVYLGHFEGARAALAKLSELSPLDPEALAAYALRVREINPSLFTRLSDDFFRRFPGHIAGAEILAKAAAHESDLAARIALLEKLKALYPPVENEVSEWHMRFLFDAYNRTNPAPALSLAQEMTLFMPARSEAARDWQACVQYGQAMVLAQSLLNRGSYTQVAGALSKATPPDLISPDPQTMILAEAAEMSGNPTRAYQILVSAMAQRPSDALQATLLKIGMKLKKTAAAIENEIWAEKVKKAPKFKDPSFSLTSGTMKIRLSEFRGRVVLLRLWHPDDGVSREEFPVLQRMLEKFKSRGFEIITVNMANAQDSLATLLTFRYGFTILKAPGYQLVGYALPRMASNILIDREGRLLSHPEFWGLDPQRTFELEVEAALAHVPKGAAR